MDLKICRICLQTEAKVYKINKYQLKSYYEEILALKVVDKDGLPHYFCYECATMLHKFHKFKEKCYAGQKLLREILWRGPITYEIVHKLDRISLGLQSLLKSTATRVEEHCLKEDIHETEDSEEKTLKVDVKTEEQTAVEEVNCNGDFSDSEIDFEEVSVTVERSKSDDEDVLDSSRPPEELTQVSTEDHSKKVKKRKRKSAKNKNKKSRNQYVTDNGEIIDNLNDFILKNGHWKVTNLSEEEAVKEFRAKSESKKYTDAPYKCTDCYKGFSKEVILKRHIKLRHHESVGKFECRFCHARFRLPCFLSRHLKQHFTRFHCLRCTLVCELDYTAFLHNEYHSGVAKKCVYCDQEFRHSSTYYTHLRTHRSEFVCTLCGASFVSNFGLLQHKRVTHAIDDAAFEDDDEDDVNTYCKRCDIRFETRKAYNEHLFHSVLHTDAAGEEVDGDEVIPRKILGKKLKNQITNENKNISSNEPKEERPPPVKTTKYGRSRNRARRKIPTTCHQCGKNFDSQVACRRHHKEEHPRTPFCAPYERHICEICGASLAPGSIASHQNMHTKEKMHTCQTCHRQFYSSVSFKRHQLTHTGEKPYGCTLCDKRFTQNGSMKLHYRTFHLKEPYPKRNRWKKKADLIAAEASQEKSNEESDGSLPDPRSQSRAGPRTNVLDNSDMQFLTLS